MIDLHYGIACYEAVQYSRDISLLDHLFTDFTNNREVVNEEEKIQAELQQLSQYHLQLVPDSNLQARYRMLDASFKAWISGFTFPDDEDGTKKYRGIIADIFADVLPLVYKIKLHYQRPRPMQFLPFFKDVPPFHAFSSLLGQSPAYPSAHTCLAHVIFGVCGNLYPQNWPLFKDVANDVQQSRLYMGQCLPSDAEGARELAALILADREFIVKYGL